jgi:hypothetical protein
MRKPNYRQQKKSREDARKVRQAMKQERRQTQPKEPGEVDPAQDAGSKPSEAH